MKTANMKLTYTKKAYIITSYMKILYENSL